MTFSDCGQGGRRHPWVGVGMSDAAGGGSFRPSIPSPGLRELESLSQFSVLSGDAAGWQIGVRAERRLGALPLSSSQRSKEG